MLGLEKFKCENEQLPKKYAYMPAGTSEARVTLRRRNQTLARRLFALFLKQRHDGLEGVCFAGGLLGPVALHACKAQS
jgi:hypothetical protein